MTSKDYLDTTKWAKLATQNKPLSKRQIRQVRFTAMHEGVPDRFRGAVWVALLDIENIRAQHSSKMYQKLLEFPNEQAFSDIKKDVERTMAELNLWVEGQDGGNLEGGNNMLYNVLMVKDMVSLVVMIACVQKGAQILVLMEFRQIPVIQKIGWIIYRLLS